MFLMMAVCYRFVGMGSIRMKSVMLHKTLSPSLTLCTKVGDPLKVSQYNVIHVWL